MPLSDTLVAFTGYDHQRHRENAYNHSDQKTGEKTNHTLSL